MTLLQCYFLAPDKVYFLNQNQYTKCSDGDREMASSAEHLLFLQRTQALFPAPMWQHTAVHNSGSRVSNVPFCLLSVPGTHIVHMEEKRSYT